ncbi:putative virion-associated RNA polymerase [Achromobacter phage vB_AxyP_19-32_Axy04]|uniref:Putative virion-associated RNA polymerase n=1 Tax=Achromobacter phage vB_AxyP_19-32_Axy04 TaxID=2591039 RepID=A0A514CTB6_9CAUD|nr:virion RNA polymerase [Achromobacter phage vB_AxyP_19-32_Axy04]QDH83729.1 putative virion-associated RNA polymerase [Achromobacter phage vB_AxyP_19-32_Axy04]
MTSIFDRLAGFADAIHDTKRSEVASATEQKKAEAGGMEYQALAGQQAGYGLDSGSQQEQDMRTMDAASYGRKYGFDALMRRGDAAGQLIGDQSQPRTFSQGAADAVTDIGTGLANAVGGIAALGTGLVSNNAGARIAEALGDMNEFAQGTQSPALQAKRRVQAAQVAQASRDNKKKQEESIASGTPGFVAGLERLGRDIISSVGIAASDPTTLTSGISQGVGSLLAAGPLMKAVGAATGMTSTAGQAAVAIGAMEGGGAYQQTAADVMKKSHDELMKTSEDYRAFLDQGFTQDEAKRRLAGQAGQIAAAIQAPIGAATGPLVGRLESAPFSVGSLGSIASNMLRETVEEGIQSGTGQLAQNIATQAKVDKNQDLLEGVGEQAGMGALYGMGTAGAVQVPGGAAKAAAPIGRTTMAAARGVGNVVNAATAPAREALIKRGEAVMAQNEKASPISDTVMAEANAEAVATAPQAEETLRAGVEATTATPEEKAAANQYITDLMEATRFNPAELDSPMISDAVRTAVGDATTRTEAFNRLADFVNQAEEGSMDQLGAALALHDMTNNVSSFIERSPAALDQMPKGHEANAVLDQFSGLIGNLANTPKVLRAYRTIQNMLADAQVAPVTEESLATPEGEQNVRVAVAQAEVAPEKANPEVIGQILKHASEGKIALSNPQIAALKSASALLQGAREYDAQAQKLGLRPQDVVSMQIKTDESRSGEGQYSALQHAKGIRSAYNAGNFDLAAARLDDFIKFAQHMQNKVGALNTHLATGNGDANRSVKYQALTPSREWVESKKGLGVNPQNAKSVQFAQQVALEAATVGQIANNLASAYPELQVGHVELVPLDSRLDKPAAQVVQEFKQADSAVVTPEVKPEPAKVKEEAPKTPVVEDAPTVTPETAPVQEQVQEPVTKVTEVQQEPAPEVKREGIDAAFPDLVGSIDPQAEGIKNYFKQSFSLPEEPKTRITGDEAPLTTVRQALGSKERMAAFMGQEVSKDFDTDLVRAYKAVFSYGETLASSLRSSLAKFLAEKNVGERFAKGTEANRWAEGKLLNIVRPSDGSFAYDESLLQSAVLAGLQWQLTAVDRGAIKDAKDAKALTGLEEGEQPAGLVEKLNSGLTLTEAANSLAQKIEAYWGFNRNRNAPLGYVRGIPLAMAAEMLQALVAAGGVEVERIYLSDTGVMLQDEKGASKTIDIYRPMKQDKDSIIRAFPTAIEEAVLMTPEEKTYFGDERPAVPHDQLRNPGTANTPEDRAALKNEIDTPFRLHKPMVDFFAGLGQDRVLELMGAGRINENMLNVNHAISLEGQNRSLAAAYNHLEGLVAQVSNQAEDITSVPMHFGYNMTRVGRMQMLGKYNPQSTKLVREALLPTQSTLDLSSENGRDFSRFALGLAQALGIKVHNMSREAATEKLMAALNGKLKPSVDMLNQWLETSGDLPADAVSTLKEGLGGDLSFVALHALVEYARYQRADAAARASFETPLYVEADGVTNGPINAMVLMSAGPFDADFIRNSAKGGLFLTPGMTMNEHRSKIDGRDLYQTSTDALAEGLKALRQQVSSDAGMTNQLNQLQRIMDLFLPDLSVDENGNLELKRGIAKNPLTITIYGSGAKGIAGKMVSSVVDSIYERMSAAVQAVTEDPSLTPAMALFGSQAESVEHANQMMEQFATSLEALTTAQPAVRKDRMVLESVDAPKRSGLNPQTFTLTPDELNTMQTNMLHLFVNPMRDAITKTIGSSLMDSTKQLQKATQVQSLFLQEAFRDAVQAKLEEKAKDPNWKKGDFLSQAELDSIQKSLGKYAPLVETGSQNFYIAGSQNSEVAGMDYARALNGKMRVAAQVYGPSDAGVAGIPVMTIGTGDGQMMQTLATMKGKPTGTLKIFDGMNMKLSSIEADAQKANQAVYESWMGNPLQAVSDSYQKFLKAADFSNMNDDLTTGLKRSLLEPKQWKEDVKPEILEAAAVALGERLKQSAMEAEARHRALDRVNLSIDQMAAVGEPYQTTGKLDLSLLTLDEQVATLNRLYNEELNKLQSPSKKAEPVASTVAPEKLNPAFEAVGRVHKKSGARILSVTAIRNLGKISKFSPEQAAVLNEIQKSLAAKDYKMILGTPEQVNLYAQLTGKQSLTSEDLAEAKKGNIDGWTTFDDKTMYMTRPSNETLIHEMVHAATFEKVYAHYNGSSDIVVAQAIGRIEKLMDQFTKLDTESLSPEFQSAHADAMDAITSFQQDGFIDPSLSKAGALNEFMAWALTNRELTARQKATAVNPLVRIAKEVLAGIKSLIWGRKVVPNVGDDMFSNLLFNSAIIMRAQPSTAAVTKDSTLFMSRAYGDSERLAQLKGTFDSLISDYLTGSPVQSFERMGKHRLALTQALALSRNVQAHGFPMTMQEQGVFRNVVAALATEVAVDPHALARAQELYSHVTKTVKVEDFMADPQGNDPADRYYAQEKYDVIMGNYLTTTDEAGRSSLLPTFLALSMVHDDLRAVLAKLPVPKKDKVLGNSIDALLTNAGTKAMEALNRRLAGDTKADNVTAALDALSETIAETSQDTQSFYDAVATPTGNMIDRANDIVVNGVSRLSDAAIDKANGILANPTTSKGMKLAAQALKGVAAVATEKNGAEVSKGLMSQMNQGNKWKPFHDFINDLVGRTSENADVYDMIKSVRSQVQQDRQQFREHLPTTIAEKFSRKLEASEWTALHTGLGKTDIASLRESMSMDEIRSLLGDQKAVDSKINDLEIELDKLDAAHAPLIMKKAKQLASYMITGKPGQNLLRNAESVARLFGERARKGRALPTDAMIKAVDQLTSLYALEAMPKTQREALSSLVQSEAAGLDFSIAYMVGQRTDESAKAAQSDAARLNSYKGYIPSEGKQGMQMIVAEDTQYNELTQKSYVRVGDYRGSSADRFTGKRGYYFLPVSSRTAFSQGIMQNVRNTAGGVDTTTGYTMNMPTAGRIVDKPSVQRITQALQSGERGVENLLPVYAQDGSVVAYERSVDPVQFDRINKDQHFANMVGAWRGRQMEEAKAQFFNDALVDNLHKMYEKDVAAGRANEYVNMFDVKDPVLADAWKLVNQATQDRAEGLFGKGEFWVRKDMLNDAFGYRMASVGDAWTGNSRLSAPTQEAIKKMALGLFGNEAYKYVMNTEQAIQGAVKTAKTLIVVKSVVIPVVNFLANVYQMVGRGVPIKNIVTGLPKKTAEIHNYVNSRLRQVELEAELRAAEGDPVKERKINAEIQSITDAHKRLSIWPLIERGEFSSIADAGISRDDLLITDGKINDYMDKLAEKLPKSIRNAGRYALITKDTALFQGIQKAVEYSDFIAKALIHDDMIKRQGRTKEDADSRVTEEFINYDRLPGRFRGYMESMGLLWFYNFKIRSAKVAMSMIRNNPVHALIAGLAPTPTMFGNVGLPIEDNLFSVLAEGKLGMSMGPAMGLRAPTLNPWHNLVW